MKKRDVVSLVVAYGGVIGALMCFQGSGILLGVGTVMRLYLIGISVGLLMVLWGGYELWTSNPPG